MKNSAERLMKRLLILVAIAVVIAAAIYVSNKWSEKMPIVKQNTGETNADEPVEAKALHFENLHVSASVK